MGITKYSQGSITGAAVGEVLPEDDIQKLAWTQKDAQELAEELAEDSEEE